MENNYELSKKEEWFSGFNSREEFERSVGNLKIGDAYKIQAYGAFIVDVWNKGPLLDYDTSLELKKQTNHFKFLHGDTDVDLFSGWNMHLITRDGMVFVNLNESIFKNLLGVVGSEDPSSLLKRRLGVYTSEQTFTDLDTRENLLTLEYKKSDQDKNLDTLIKNAGNIINLFSDKIPVHFYRLNNKGLLFYSTQDLS